MPYEKTFKKLLFYRYWLSFYDAILPAPSGEIWYAYTYVLLLLTTSEVMKRRETAKVRNRSKGIAFINET